MTKLRGTVFRLLLTTLVTGCDDPKGMSRRVLN